MSHITETFFLLQTTLCPFLSILGAKSIATFYLGSENEDGEHWCETDFLNRIPCPRCGQNNPRGMRLPTAPVEGLVSMSFSPNHGRSRDQEDQYPPQLSHTSHQSSAFVNCLSCIIDVT